ncbi:uncharacterized protein LOC117125439 [Anneissia japonica]|uniref:uncharacterized protein LOC117125439 n=1 Tax=Anneissia japonica TaxID=1529436 RepID=UPI001425AAB8|nr:uncharacterized protein LOC117125439 [Anneissia japonica]
MLCVEMGNYVSRKSSLGWVLFGTNTNSTRQQHNPVLLLKLAEPVDISKFWSTEEMGVKCECNCNGKDSTSSPDEKKRFTEMWDSCKKDSDRHWVVPYPWVKSPENLCNNERQCFAKLCSLEKRLQKTPSNADQYNKAIHDLVDKGFAKKLTYEEKKNYHGPVHYIPHHAVVRPERASTPIRIVFNSSSVCEGSSLNNHWCKGPDLLQNLMGVIMRFKEFKVAIAEDISKMFYRVRIPLSDMHVHRFMWRNF